MTAELTELVSYSDDRGNSIEVEDGVSASRVRIIFRGSNNRLVVKAGAELARLVTRFDCDNGSVVIGAAKPGRAAEFSIRVGQDATVRIGQNVTTTSFVVISAVEGATVEVGDDVMFASANQLRSDDGHPIFDVRTEQRVNPARDIRIGSHVWMGREAVALGGASIGSGSVVGFRSLVTGAVPNNVVAAGSPARVLRRDVAWERPHLSIARPFYKPDASSVQRSTKYWALTETAGEDSAGWSPRIWGKALWSQARRLARGVLRTH